MEKLLSYINALSTPDQADFAFACKTTIGYLRKACSKGQLLGPALCSAIERESKNAVTRIDLHPDDWHLIWPELQKSTHTEA